MSKLTQTILPWNDGWYLFCRTPEGLEDVSKLPVLFAALLEDGWTEDELGKLASENLIRVLEKVEEVRDELSAEEPFQEWIPSSDLSSDEKKCVS